MDKVNIKEKINLILLFCEIRNGHYGLGSHINKLIGSLKYRPDIHITIIKTDVQDHKEIEWVDKDGLEILIIPSPENKYLIDTTNSLFQKRYAKRLVALINLYLGHLDNILFWVNSIDYLNVCSEIRESFHNCRIIYVHHAWSWKYFINVSDNQFSEWWKSNTITNPKAFEYTKYQQQIVKISDSTITVTNQAKKFFIEVLNIPKGKITTIYNGSDLQTCQQNKYILRLKYGFGEADKIILFVGRIREEKGLYYLLSAFKDLANEYPKTKLVIVGGGDFNKFIPIVNPLWNRVIYTGELSKHQIQELYAISDIGILPSLFEQCSYTSIEMRFNRLPLIVSSVDGLDEMFDDGFDCLKLKVHFDKKGFKVLDKAEIAHKIIFLLSDESLRERLISNSYQKALNEFTSDRMCNDYYSLIKKVMNY